MNNEKIEVIFYDRISSYIPGQVVELDDGPFLRAILKGGKADVVNPPDWSPESADAKLEQKTELEPIQKPKRKSVKNLV